jgi:hypothetical protein
MLLESRESSSPVVTRAVAQGLLGQFSDVYDFADWQKSALNVLGKLPQELSLWLIPRMNNSDALSPEIVAGIQLDDLLAPRLADYSQITGKVSAITMGVAMGGTTAHLSLATHSIFLPQAFVMTLKQGSFDGDVQVYFNRSAGLARHLTDKIPEIMSIQHYDPIHDGWLTRFVNHVRVKLVRLPELYKRFIREKLEPGGDVIYLDGQASWLRYRVGERNVFQVGGWGGISSEEFLEGSSRITAYARKTGLKFTDWRLKDFPLETGPESEWGSEEGLREDLEEFCRKEGYRFRSIPFTDPNDFSTLAFLAQKKLLEKNNIEPTGAVVEMFSQFDASAILNSGLLPLWLIFNTKDSLNYMESMLGQFPAEKPVFFSPLSTFSLTPDLVPWREWNNAFNGRPWINIGARQNHYPADTWALVHWNDALRDFCRQNPRPINTFLSGVELAELARNLAK